MSKSINIGLIGWGTVGTGVAKVLLKSPELLKLRTGVDLKLKKIADLDIQRDRGINIDKAILTTRADDVLEDPDIHIVVELVGGIEPAKTFVLKALRAGKHVVTANKALLSEHWDELQQAAHEAKAAIYFEAAVGGGIPVVQGLNDGLAANNVKSIHGIINGTANYILTEMGKGHAYQDVLKEAQEKGYAEADPTLDVGGGDTMHKLVIMASLAFGKRVDPNDVYIEGITALTAQDILYAREELEQEIKLLGIAKQDDTGKVQVRVHPTLIPAEHLLASVHGVYNGIYIIGDSVGPTMFYGKGAGEMPTASAVMSDVIFIARNIHMGVADKVPAVYYLPQNDTDKLQIEPISEVRSQYYIRFTVKEEIGVIAKIAGIFSEKGISIESVIQKDTNKENSVPIVFMTHAAKEKDVCSALQTIDALSFSVQPAFKIRVENID